MRWKPEWKLGEERKRLLKTAALAFAANKLLVVLVSTFALRDRLAGQSFFESLYHILFYNFRHFDASRYVQIATYGYAEIKDTTFFPGYPLLIRAVSSAFDIAPLTAGVLISNVAFFFLLYFFLKLALVDLDWNRARKALLLLAFFPTAYYFSAAYTEATFMLVSLLALLGMRRQRWTRAGLFGGIAGVFRNTGVLLGLPYLIEFLTDLRERKRRGELIDVWPILWVLPIVAGVGAYVVYLWVAKGDPLAFADQQKHYGRGTGTPWGTLFHGYVYGLKMLVNLHRPLDWVQVYYVTQLFFPTLVLVVLVTSFRKIRWSYWSLILCSMIVPLLAPADGSPEAQTGVIDYFVSFSRYSLVMVPLYFGLERLLRRRWAFWGYMSFSALFLVLLTYAWSRHWWVA